MNTSTTVRRLSAIILSASLVATAFAGLRDVSTPGWQTKTNGGLAALKAQGVTQVAPTASGGAKMDAVTNYVPGEIVVKLRKNSQAATALESAANQGKTAAVALGGTNELSVLLQKHGATPKGTVFSRAKRDPGGASLRAKTVQETQRDGLFRWHRLQIPKDADMKQVLADFKANPAVEYAEPVFEYRLAGEVPNATTDPKMGAQWHLAKIKAQQAWRFLETNGIPLGGERDVVVAVIDSGVDYNHEDLVGNMWTNPREIAGNGIDDDGNGFVDDIHGCSVVSDARSHSGDPIDLNGHGTHVAGIIDATAYNGKGGVGVAFNVQIMAIRAGQSSGILTTTDISEGILYAVDNGAEVINMSFGGPQRSQIMEEALQVALNQAVLVAAAGNGINGIGVSKQKLPFYPAALPYVLGVMSSTIDDKYALSSNTGYDLAAPGEGILSTWPGNRYSTLSGTSMAAPVASGLAALIRSFWSQRELYSSRFVMGQVADCAKIMVGSPPGTPPVVNAFSAVTERAAPGVVLLENWLLDGKAISARNDADGRVDSGETINLGIVVQNRSGLASNMVATLAAPSDPYVTFLTNTVQFGNIGSMSTMDNGFIKTTDGVITGVERPFVFQVVSNCPNDHVIAFEITFTYRDGWNPENTHVFTPRANFDYVVQRGKNVPGVISTNMVLAADDFWLVASPVLIEPGVTLTIGPGTQVQWGGVSDDPYNPGPQNGNIIVRGNLRVEGTSDQPVSFFPSYLVAGQLVTIAVEGGTADLAFVKVRNPSLTGFRNIDHGDFEWDFGATTITAQSINNSMFHKFRGGGSLSAKSFDSCLFDAGWIGPSFSPYWHANPYLTPRIHNCTFLQDNENDRMLTAYAMPTTGKNALGQISLVSYMGSAELRGISNPVTRSNHTYATMPAEIANLQQAELVAQFFGGHVASISDAEEQAFLENYVQLPRALGSVWAAGIFLIGLTDAGHPGDYRWLDGSALNYTNWGSNNPVVMLPYLENVVAFCAFSPNQAIEWVGTWRNMEAMRAGRSGWEVGTYGGGPLFILKLPGVWTEAQLNAPVTSGELLSFVRPRLRGPMLYNAFLSKYWDPNVSRWMRIRTYNTEGIRTYAAMHDNYWGTASTALIDPAILDYNDDFVSSTLDYQPPPTNGFTTTYPFVERVLMNGVSAETQPQLSAGQTEFTVTFNRDMNTNIEPFVTFGPIPPHTDFSVTARDADFHPMTNGWLNARTWQGAAQLSQFTGEGYQMMRISGAVAADDPWLVSGYDVGRFRFSVKTMGVLSMTLQAIGQEGAIQLTWQQNDYDLLAGYNIYRADSTNGPWTRLNDIVIPPGSESFSDTNVPPAVPKFYMFKVVTTDMRESEPSNLAVASALDTIAPVLTHTAVTSALPTRGLRISATATDNLRITSVTLFYRLSGSGSNYTSMAMVNVAGNDWSATIPGSAAQSPGVDYYLTATDGISEVFSGTPLLPHVVLVSNVPTLGSVTPNHGPSTGGTAVTLSGTLFEPGVSVLFGGVLASNVTLTSANQLTCLTPPHFPALVDVTIANTNGTQSTLLSAFQYEQTGVIVSLPVTNGNYGTQVELGLSVAGVVGLRAGDVTITFDPTVLSAVDARVGPLAAGWALSANLNTPGRAVLSLANASSVTGSGSLVLLRFDIVKAPPASTALTMESVSLNDGAMTATRSHGSLTVNGFFALGGTIRYFGGGQVVPGASLALVGAGVFQTSSDTNGGFSITNVPTGSYVLTPTKTNQVAEITGYDAALVLQAAAGLVTLSPSQVLAADVNRNGSVSAMDASYILEKAVGLIEGSFPGAGRLWDFTPAQRSYSLLNSDQSGQDFTAVLIGDVSGNWTPPVGAGAPTGGRVSKGGDDPPNSVVIGMDNGPLNGTVGERNARVLLKATEASVYGIDLVLSYAPTNRTVAEVRRGGLAGEMALAANTNQAGVVRTSLAGAAPLSGSGSLLVVSFAGNEPVTWHLDQARINEGQVSVILDTVLAAFDTDGDGLIDEDEIAVFHTDPIRRDTDGDGMTDGAEVRAGTDPLNKADVFAVVQADSAGGLTRVVWTVKANKTYQVLKSLDLRSWTDAPNGVGSEQQSRRTAVANGLLEYAELEPANSGGGRTFYRVKLVE
jgi:subtilisin family serine protease